MKPVSRHVGLRRLLVLAEYLQTLPRSKFDMGTWCSGRTMNECGATACAFGHAVEIPAFQRAGLRMCDSWGELVPQYRGVDGFDAAGLFFAISDYDATHLFSESKLGETPKQVAKRIRAFVAEQS